MKALKATLTTSQPVISPDDFSTVFYRIPDLYNAHKEFLDGLKEQTTENSPSSNTIGDLFQTLVRNINKNTYTTIYAGQNTQYKPT